MVWLHGTVRTPPVSRAARLHAGFLLRSLQQGDRLDLPHSRPMPAIGPRCHELRVPDGDLTWRVVVRIDSDAIVVGEVFAKKTRTTPHQVIAACRQRFSEYDRLSRHEG